MWQIYNNSTTMSDQYADCHGILFSIMSHFMGENNH
jgi:hypothetical protein